MSDVRLVVREEGRDWSGTIHGSFADRAIAALSADPVTLAELEAAMARFARPNPDRPLLASLKPGLDAEPYDAGLVVIDLAARLIVEEVACNAVEHAVAPDAPLEMHARVDAGRLWLEFRDRGAPFDPTTVAAPDLDADIGDRGVGGLGVFLVRELADEIEYQRVDEVNVLRITLRLDAAHDMESRA